MKDNSFENYFLNFLEENAWVTCSKEEYEDNKTNPNYARVKTADGKEIYSKKKNQKGEKKLWI